MIRSKRTDSARRLMLLGTASFLILCGIFVFALGGPSSTTADAPDSAADQVRAARDRALDIERALADGNYGSAQEAIVQLRDELDEALDALED